MDKLIVIHELKWCWKTFPHFSYLLFLCANSCLDLRLGSHLSTLLLWAMTSSFRRVRSFSTPSLFYFQNIGWFLLAIFHIVLIYCNINNKNSNDNNETYLAHKMSEANWRFSRCLSSWGNELQLWVLQSRVYQTEGLSSGNSYKSYSPKMPKSIWFFSSFFFSPPPFRFFFLKGNWRPISSCILQY